MEPYEFDPPTPTKLSTPWVCCLGAVGASLTFGVVRGAGAFAAVLPTFVLVSGIQLAQRYRGNIATSFSAASSSRREAMVGGALATETERQRRAKASGDISLARSILTRLNWNE
jgi:hypothetical protein